MDVSKLLTEAREHYKKSIAAIMPNEPLQAALPSLNCEITYLDGIKHHDQITDDPYLFQARMKEIIRSDHPMLVDAVRKLYALGKLCLPMENDQVLHAQKMVDDCKSSREKIEKENAQREHDYKISLQHYYNTYNEAYRKSVDYWNELVTQITTAFDKQPKRVPISKLPLRLKFFVTLIKKNKELFEDFPLNWHQDRPCKASVLFSLKFNESIPTDRYLNDDVAHKAKILLDEYHNLHSTFMAEERMRLREIVTKSEEYTSIQQDILRKIQFAKRDMKDMTWVYFDRIQKSPTDPYHDRRYRDEVRMVHQSAQDRLDCLSAELEFTLIRMVFNLQAEMQIAGVDGYDEIYAELYERADQKHKKRWKDVF